MIPINLGKTKVTLILRRCSSNWSENIMRMTLIIKCVWYIITQRLKVHGNCKPQVFGSGPTQQSGEGILLCRYSSWSHYLVQKINIILAARCIINLLSLIFVEQY